MVILLTIGISLFLVILSLVKSVEDFDDGISNFHPYRDEEEK